MSIENRIPTHIIHLLYCGIAFDGHRVNHYDALVLQKHINQFAPSTVIIPTLLTSNNNDISIRQQVISSESQKNNTIIQQPIESSTTRPILLTNTSSTNTIAKQYNIDELTTAWENSIIRHYIGGMSERCTDMTYRTHRVLTPQEYENNIRIENLQQLLDNNMNYDVQLHINEHRELQQNKDESNTENWSRYFHRIIIPGDGNCFFIS